MLIYLLKNKLVDIIKFVVKKCEIIVRKTITLTNQNTRKKETYHIGDKVQFLKHELNLYLTGTIEAIEINKEILTDSKITFTTINNKLMKFNAWELIGSKKL